MPAPKKTPAPVAVTGVQHVVSDVLETAAGNRYANAAQGPLEAHPLADPFLAESAERIRMLGRRVIGDIIEIGRLLTECKERCGHGHWLPWLEQEFGWDERTAQRYMSAHALAGKYDKLSDLSIGVSSLYLLAAPSTPESAQTEIIERAEAGEQLKHAEVREIIAAHGRDAVLAAATQIRAGDLQARDDARKAEFERPVLVSLAPGLHHGDFRVLADAIEDASVDLVLTDPPYDETLLYGDAARTAARILKPGGSFLAYVGQHYQFAAMAACGEHLRYLHTNAVIHAGGSNLLGKLGVRCGWKPVLWYVRGTRADPGNIIFDVISGGGREKELHEWQQSQAEAEYLIDKLSSPDGLVVDFMVGSGTTGAAAKALGRRWIGFEIDAATAARASERIEAATVSSPAPPAAAPPPPADNLDEPEPDDDLDEPARRRAAP
jgi:hypothetical protein